MRRFIDEPKSRKLAISADDPFSRIFMPDAGEAKPASRVGSKSECKRQSSLTKKKVTIQEEHSENPSPLGGRSGGS
jgi:hypothetical protein